VRPFGDLVILIKPAFEAARYQALYTQCLPNRPSRWISTRLEAVRLNALSAGPADAQKEANLNTIGPFGGL
jgi:hypothetical protein